MARKVAARLNVPCGTHYKKGTKTLITYAFTKAIHDRPLFIARAKEAAKPREELMPGDTVLCRGQLAELTSYDEQTGHCCVTFMAMDGQFSQSVHYTSRFGNQSKSARLQRVPVLLQPQARKRRDDRISDEVLDHVATIYENNCPTSPHQRDKMRRLLASRCWEEMQA